MKGQTLEDKANSIFMFSLYFAILMSVLRQNPRFMVLVLVGAFLSIGLTGSGIGGNLKSIKLNDMVNSGVLDRVPKEGEIVDTITQKVCTAPTPDNPAMNWINGDRDDKAPACDLDNDIVQEQSKKYINDQVYRTQADIWQKNPYDYWYTTAFKGEKISNLENYLTFLFKDQQTPRCKEMGQFKNASSKVLAGAQCYKQSVGFVPPQ